MTKNIIKVRNCPVCAEEPYVFRHAKTGLPLVACMNPMCFIGREGRSINHGRITTLKEWNERKIDVNNATEIDKENLKYFKY